MSRSSFWVGVVHESLADRSIAEGTLGVGNPYPVPDHWEDAMKIVYFVTSGTGDATKASIPLHLAANGSVEVGQETSIVLAGDATELLLEDNAERLAGVGVPPARELLSKLREHEVPVHV
jgi:hypothetical protein